MITIEPPRELADGLDAWRAVGLSRAGLSGFLRRAQEAVGLEGEVEVLLAGDRTLRRLNREFRGKNKATDVLSFPAMAEMAGVFAGDLAISLETAGRQAAEHGHSLRDEVRVLLLHGLLHLSGMDHEVDEGEMAEREGLLRAKLRLPSGLIARVEGVSSRSPKGMTERKARTKASDAKGAKLNGKLRELKRERVAARKKVVA
jgi:probable rRNA maturation factor